MLLEAGYEVDVVCLRGPEESRRDTYHGVQIHRLSVQIHKDTLIRQSLNYVHFFLRALWKVSALHFRRRYRSVQVHNLPDFLVFCAIVPKVFGAAIVLDLHDLMPEFFAGRFGYGNRVWIQKAIILQERLACRFADHVITVSDHWRAALIKRGLSSEKTSVVINAADGAIFRPSSPRRTQQAGSMALIYHGTVAFRHGLDLVIEAIAILHEDAPNLTLTVLGRGDYIATLRDQARRLGLQSRVSISNDYVLAEKLPAILEEADMGIVPYRNDVFTDSLIPTKLLEYAALGIPSIAARTSAIHGLASDTMVHYFRPGDAEDLSRQLLLLYREPRRRQELAQATEQLNLRYNWTDVGSRYVELIRSMSTTSTFSRLP